MVDVRIDIFFKHVTDDYILHSIDDWFKQILGA